MEGIRKYFGFIVLIILGFIPLLPLFHAGLPITHDGQDHVARIANFYSNLTYGTIIPRWAGNLNWGYGHPILMFLYPLPSYAASFFHVLGFSFVDSVKIVFGLSFVLSGITMYLWIRNVFGEKAGILAGVLYMFAPYRFVDLYVRGAIGEHVAFVFVPLVFYFLLKLTLKKSLLNVIGGAISVALLLLSHNAFAVMFLPIAGVYACILIYKSKNKKLLVSNYVLLTALGFGLSAFFVLPAFFEGKYTLRDIVTNHGEYRSGFTSFVNFIVPSWSYGGSDLLSKQIGIVGIAGIILAVIALCLSKSKKNLALFALLFASLIFSLFLMTSYSDVVWQHISLIQKFQFPWRLLSVVVFATAGISAFILVKGKKDKRITYLIIVLCVSAVVLYFPYYKPQGYLVKPESFYMGVYSGTTDTGESSPIWSVRFMEHKAQRPAEVIDGNAKIVNIGRTPIMHTYKITVSSNKARIRENTLYFPGWEVTINGKPTTIEFQDRLNRGLITYYVARGVNNVTVEFKDTKLRMLSDIITLASTITIGVLLVIVITKKFRK